MIWYDMMYDMMCYDTWYMIHDMIYDMVWNDIWYDTVWYDIYDMVWYMIYLLTAIGLSPGEKYYSTHLHADILYIYIYIDEGR